MDNQLFVQWKLWEEQLAVTDTQIAERFQANQAAQLLPDTAPPRSDQRRVASHSTAPRQAATQEGHVRRPHRPRRQPSCGWQRTGVQRCDKFESRSFH